MDNIGKNLLNKLLMMPSNYCSNACLLHQIWKTKTAEKKIEVCNPILERDHCHEHFGRSFLRWLDAWNLGLKENLDLMIDYENFQKSNCWKWRDGIILVERTVPALTHSLLIEQIFSECLSCARHSVRHQVSKYKWDYSSPCPCGDYYPAKNT